MSWTANPATEAVPPVSVWPVFAKRTLAKASFATTAICAPMTSAIARKAVSTGLALSTAQTATLAPKIVVTPALDVTIASFLMVPLAAAFGGKTIQTRVVRGSSVHQFARSGVTAETVSAFEVQP
jgi:hypothetical protein